ncbi:MAG: efflux transporter periplasmic adaptor subunit, partial [Cyanobacteria bacterium J06626_14]
ANQLDISPGQIAELTIAQATPESGYWVPTAALVPSDRGLWACYVLVEDDSSLEASAEASDLNSSGSTYRVERREVEVLHTDGTQSFIRGTVESGDRMVSSGTQRLVPGQQVRWAES